MSNHEQVTTKRPRSNGNGSKNAAVIETDNHSVQAQSTTRSAPLVAAHLPSRESMIASAAYHRAEDRGFEPGHDVEDWLAAEMELDQRMMGEGRAY